MSPDLSLNSSQLSRQPSLSSEKGAICHFGVRRTGRCALPDEGIDCLIAAAHRPHRQLRDAYVTQNHRFARHGTFFQRWCPPHSHHRHLARHRARRGQTADQGRPHGLPREQEQRPVRRGGRSRGRRYPDGLRFGVARVGARVRRRTFYETTGCALPERGHRAVDESRSTGSNGGRLRELYRDEPPGALPAGQFISPKSL